MCECELALWNRGKEKCEKNWLSYQQSDEYESGLFYMLESVKNT